MKPRHLNNERGFLSDYFLGSVLARGGRSSGPTDREADAALRRYSRLRERAEEKGRCLDAGQCRERFVRPFLREVLGFHIGEGADRIHPLWASADEEVAKKPPLLLIYCGEWDEDLSAGRGATPAARLEKALAARSLRHGLLATGERLRLIRTAGDGPKGAYLEADLAGLAEETEPASFTLFHRLFHISCFTPGSAGRAPIDEIEEESRKHAEKVSEDLKGAVFSAAEELVSALLAALPEKERDLRLCRDAALIALYRILFILYAEARDRRLQEHRLYRDSYSVEGLVRELFEEPARQWPANSHGLWERLQTVFRIYDQGLPKTDRWDNIPARGGQFFSALTEEGKLIECVRLPDSVVARVILNLAATQPRHGVGLERISFAELDIESLGAVYEGLLEYEPRVAKELLLEVSAKGGDYALAPTEVVRLCRQLKLRLKDPESLAVGTEVETIVQGTSSGEGTDDNPEPEEIEEEGEAPAHGGTAMVLRRLEPGQFFFIPGAGRKGSGSFYTPLPLVRDLINHALGPFVRGKTPAEIESLRVLDPSCGSAHFLVEAMRFMGQELHRAYIREYKGKPPPGFTHGAWDKDCEAPDDQARASNSEARAWCKRRIAERCLFGVDYNPTAASLARVALWIESLAGDRPLSYFDHHVRCGNSLLGTWLKRLDKSPHPDLEDVNLAQDDLFAASTKYVEEARRVVLEAAKARRLIDQGGEAGVEPDSIEELEYKEQQKREADVLLADARLLFDLRSASAFLPIIWHDWSTLCSLLGSAGKLKDYAGKSPWWPEFEKIRERERFFHWEIEFPEVFLDKERPGFDVVLGNPPWEKIKSDRTEFFGAHDVLLRALVGGELDARIEELSRIHAGLDHEFELHERRVDTLVAHFKKGADYSYQDWKVGDQMTGGDPDLFKLFAERAWRLLRPGGRAGMVLPAALYNSDGATGLRHLLLSESQIERFYGFENRLGIFPIHRMYKFLNLVFRKGKPENTGFGAAFMRWNVEELQQTGSKPWMIPVRREELERLSPGSLAFLEFRSPRDREVLIKMYGSRPVLGDSGPGTWDARLHRELHMTDDRGLWTDRDDKLFNPCRVLGKISGTIGESPFYDPKAWSDIRERMAEKGFWPLYEGKHIEQFLVDLRPIERWVSLEAHKRERKEMPDANPKLVFRSIASNTNERTCIAAALPERSCFAHSMSRLRPGPIALNAAATILNSFVFDWALRFRVAGNLSFVFMSRMPIISAPAPATVIPTVSAGGGNLEHYSDRRELWPRAWASNRAVAEAYDLGPDDFDHILAAFPVFARKRPEFHAYLLERLAEWKAEKPASRGRKRASVA